MLEYEIAPAYYAFNDQGVPVEWMSLVKNTMVKIAPEFTMKRQIDDYYDKYYYRLFVRNKYLINKNFEKLKSWQPGNRQCEKNGIILRLSTIVLKKPVKMFTGQDMTTGQR